MSWNDVWLNTRIRELAADPNLSLDAAQDYVVEHQSHCQEMIDDFQEDYYSLLFDNYSVSVVKFTDESELKVAEKQSINVLRPPLNDH